MFGVWKVWVGAAKQQHDGPAPEGGTVEVGLHSRVGGVLRGAILQADSPLEQRAKHHRQAA